MSSLFLEKKRKNESYVKLGRKWKKEDVGVGVFKRKKEKVKRKN